MYVQKQYFHYQLFFKICIVPPLPRGKSQCPGGPIRPESYTLLKTQYIHTVSIAETKCILHNILNVLYCMTFYIDVIKQYLYLHNNYYVYYNVYQMVMYTFNFNKNNGFTMDTYTSNKYLYVTRIESRIQIDWRFTQLYRCRLQ